jgi:ubiquitin-like protein Pup
MEQARAQRPKAETEETTAGPPPAASADKKAHDAKLKADLDDILDEIDEVLEDNAATFVSNYVQKGGQ